MNLKNIYPPPLGLLSKKKKFNPEYNIAKKPGSPMSGRKHMEESKSKISDALTG